MIDSYIRDLNGYQQGFDKTISYDGLVKSPCRHYADFVVAAYLRRDASIAPAPQIMRALHLALFQTMIV